MPTSDAHTLPGSVDEEEIEWQFDADDLERVANWLDQHAPGPDGMAIAGVTVHPRPEKRIHDTYLDTEDWRMARAGYALRVRRGGGAPEATLKAFGAAVNGLRRRRELTEPLDTDADADPARAPGAVGAWVRALAAGRGLRTLFEIHSARRTYALAIEGTPAGEITLDTTEAPARSGGEPGRLSRVEIEVPSHYLTAVEPFVAELRRACDLVPATRGKFDLGLAVNALTPPAPPDLGPDAIDDTMSVGEVAFAVLRRHFAAFLRHEPGTRIGEDPEELHDMRVATRRLRAALSLFAPALPPRAERFRSELRWIAGLLGDVRDGDVQIARLAELRTALGDDGPDPEALAPLLSLFRHQRDEARGRLLRALDSRRYDRLIALGTELLRRGPGRSEAARLPVLAVAPDLVRERYRKFRRLGDRLDPSSPPEAYHRLRIRGKRLRYAVEFVAEIYGKPARRFARSLADLQDVLGAHQDAYVAIERLQVLSAGPLRLPPRTLFAMGRLAEHERAHAADLRARFPEAYAEVTGANWRQLRRRMERRRVVPWPRWSTRAESRPEPAADEATEVMEPISIVALP